MNKWTVFINFFIPANYIWISASIFDNEEKSEFYPYIITLLIFVFHVAGIFIFSRIKKLGLKWNFLNFILLMVALGVNIFILENYIFE